MNPNWRSPSISWRGGNVNIPAHTHGMLVNYIERGEDPFSDFIYAILTNDLKKAMHSADNLNLPMIHHITAWLYNYAPSACQGSSEKVDKWIEIGGLEGATKRKLQEIHT